jgi:hypothetical protein
VHDFEPAEKLTIKAVKKVLDRFGRFGKDEEKFSAAIFMCARSEIHENLKRLIQSLFFLVYPPWSKR